MELKSAEEMIEILQGKGFEAELYERYSGRCMYGNTTTGVTTDARPYMMEGMTEDGEELEGWDFRNDNMGLDYIYY